MQVQSAHSFLKFLDQPVLLEKLSRSVPVLLPLTGAAYLGYDTLRTPQEQRPKKFVKTLSVLAFTIGAALWSARLFALFEPYPIRQAAKEVISTVKHAKKAATRPIIGILNKAQTQILSPGEIHNLRQGLIKVFGDKKGNALFAKIVPEPENLTAKEVLGEIKDLSLMGLFPVVGGIIGGLVGNVATRDDYKNAFKNQAKEGLYQYLANIFLCNVGAGVSLLALEKTPYKNSRLARLSAMTIGITLFGILGGSSIANFFGKNFFNPLFDKGPQKALEDLNTKISREGWGSLFKNLNSERHPELLDVGLHADDMATVGVLSGLKWIEPALPFMYALSGFRAGIGYRNGHTKDKPSDKTKPFQAGIAPKPNTFSVTTQTYPPRTTASHLRATTSAAENPFSRPAPLYYAGCPTPSVINYPAYPYHGMMMPPTFSPYIMR